MSINKTNLVFNLLICLVMLISCSEEKTDSITEDSIEDSAPLGLIGDTYRNRRYLFKVSKLPLDGWTIFTSDTPSGKEFITTFYGKKEENEHWSSHILVALPTTLDAISNIEDKTLENVVGLTHVYLLIDIEILSKAETDFVRSAQDLAQEYKVQKAASGLPMTSESEVKSADGYMGYAIYGDFDEAEVTVEYGYAFFTRPSGRTQRIYRLAYFEVYDVGGTGKIRSIFNQIVSSIEFNTL